MNLKTFGDYKKEDKTDDKKKNTTSYTGGQSSGMAVINPDVAKIIEKAQKSSKSPEEPAKGQKGKNGHTCKITLYKNGFVVDDGDFRDYNQAKNKDFMKEIYEGYVPKELRKSYPNGDVSVSLDDKTQEQYVPPPPPAYVQFSGQGVSLSATNSKQTKFAKKSKACQNFILQPDKKKQVTTIKVKLSNGQTVPMQVNLDTSLQDVYNHIATLSGISNFELIGGYPPKPLNLSSNIESSDLAGSTIIQK